MSEAPRISILLPSLNQRKFLESRLSSFLAQSFSDWEVIVLDSHSTDGSWEFFKAVAERDSRFRVQQVPQEGLYAALNRGLALAKSEFLYIAPCDDTMAPEFFSEMIAALERSPEAGIAVCDCLFINEEGSELQPNDMTSRLSNRKINNLLRSGTVRTSRSSAGQRTVNYRPPPHDCLLHFTGRSVYFSLTQLLVRTASAKAAGHFDTNVGSPADFGWLLRLTSLTGSLHLPKKMATWRFHGDQISLRREDSRLGAMAQMCRDILPELRRRYPGLLTETDGKLLLLPYKAALAKSVIGRVAYWLYGFARILPTLLARPLFTLKILCRTAFRPRMSSNFLFATIFERRGIAPRQPKIIS